MPKAKVNGVELYYELTGSGDPLVLVHGSWVSHHSWDPVVPRLAESFRVLSYDRRGHSESARQPGHTGVRRNVDDLAALIERLDLAPAWIVGNSFGAVIALRLATRRPELLRGLIVHEPPLFPLLADDPASTALLDGVASGIGAVNELIAAGDHARAAELFVETVALGPGTWSELPPEFQQTLIGNAATFMEETRDPEQLAFDTAWVSSFPRPFLLTMGDLSPPTYAPVVAKLAEALPGAEVLTFAGAGHIPHVSHPDAYVDAIVAFTGRSGA